MAEANGSFGPRLNRGFTCSTFDLLHPGHVKMLEFCKAHCSYLIVGLQTAVNDRPDKARPLQTVYERWVQIKAVRWVDEVVPYESERDLMNIFHTMDIDVRFVGEEYKGRDFTGKRLFNEALRPKLIYTPRRHDWSSTELRGRLSPDK